MSKNIIFLDIDGVIATNRSYKEYDTKIDPGNVEIINELAQAFDARIVMSSTWRLLYDIDTLRLLLKNSGLKPKVLDCTPERDDRQRGLEIQDWIKEHGADDYIVIDDDCADIIPHIPKKNFIHVKNGFTKIGITQSHIIDFLRKRKKEKKHA